MRLLEKLRSLDKRLRGVTEADVALALSETRTYGAKVLYEWTWYPNG